MFVDLREVPDGTEISAEICIVGAGAAGITLAREFNGSGMACALLESGGLEFDSKTQELYAGDNIGRPFLDLTTCRLRYFGGSANYWAGWCLPLDPIDFETRAGACPIEAGPSAPSNCTDGIGGHRTCANLDTSITPRKTGALCGPTCRQLFEARISCRKSPG